VRLFEMLAAARQEAASPLSEAWGECQSLLDLLDAAPDQEAARVRLRAALRRIVEEIRCLFVARGPRRLAAVQVNFSGGGRRDYLIMHRAATGGSVPSRKAEWRVRSWRAEDLERIGLPQPDLRNPDEPAGMESHLLALTQHDLENLVFRDCEPHPLP
jgi:hypothetical protein